MHRNFYKGMMVALFLFSLYCLQIDFTSSASFEFSFVLPPNGFWRPTATVDAPTGRYGHTAIWTGSKMLVWGGYFATDNFLNDGALYDSLTDTWAPITTTNAPIGRLRHTAVWTGQKMIVWGGESAGGGATTNTGGVYDLALDTWTPATTTNAPSQREMHSAVWAGSEMIVWGGCSTIFCTQIFNDGGRYDPVSDSWTLITGPVSLAPRNFHQAFWTGSRMILWGGTSDPQVASYDPNANVWTLITASNAPTPTFQGAGVWTGQEMIVWGGCTNFTTTPCTSYVNSGGRYNPNTFSWAPITTTNSPASRWTHSAVWTGQRLIVWAGCGVQCYNDGSFYDPITDAWTTLNDTNAPAPRSNHKAVWTGTTMVVWGGCSTSGCINTTYLNSGGRFTMSLLYLPFVSK